MSAGGCSSARRMPEGCPRGARPVRGSHLLPGGGGQRLLQELPEPRVRGGGRDGAEGQGDGEQGQGTLEAARQHLAGGSGAGGGGGRRWRLRCCSAPALGISSPLAAFINPSPDVKAGAPPSPHAAGGGSLGRGRGGGQRDRGCSTLPGAGQASTAPPEFPSPPLRPPPAPGAFCPQITALRELPAPRSRAHRSGVPVSPQRRRVKLPQQPLCQSPSPWSRVPPRRVRNGSRIPGDAKCPLKGDCIRLLQGLGGAQVSRGVLFASPAPVGLSSTDPFPDPDPRAAPGAAGASRESAPASAVARR